MTILPLHPASNASPEALHAFLAQCRAAAAKEGRAKLVSISLAVDALDPLAVLESIFEPDQPHFYAERPSIDSAIAGAEVATSISAQGPERFAAVQRWIDETLAGAIAVGDVGAPFGGPHFFAGFTFHDEVEAGEPFAPAFAFVPRWQVALAGTTTTAVANLLVAPDADLSALTERVWRAHRKFRQFEYGRRDVVESMAGLGGMGVSPMGSAGSVAEHRRDVHATQTNAIHIRQGANLPHWTREGAIYAVTFRLADSLPAHVIESWRAERTAIHEKSSLGERPLTVHERDRLLRLHSEKMEALLDEGSGACFLRQPPVAELVVNSLSHFDGQRYELHAWCVMPNHVHAVLRPLPGNALEDILHAWKSYTAKKANAALGRTGDFWQAESYDHLIRDETDYAHAIDYVLRNPEKAGLKNWRWRGPRVTGVPPVGLGGMSVSPMGSAGLVTEHGRDAHATRATQTHGRDARATQTFTTREAGNYRTAVARALERIAAGEFNKIVLARAQDLTAHEPLHPLEMLNGLRQRFPECYAFSFAAGKGPSFIGASPERLVRVSQGTLETEALAGSIRRGAGASEDAALAGSLLRSEKDLREHREVLDDIVARLTPLGVVPQHPLQPQVRRLANVQHLHTPVRAPLPEGVRLLDVLAAMHPTPAVGGTPRGAAVARIRELEDFPRGLYGGALGWLNARGGGEFFVGIRSALVQGASARVYAGAGIVAGSTPEKEFAETELKFKAMLDALLSE